MKAIVCEMCGGHELLKEDGVFVCQHCGTKYSPEEARKLMIEGPVDVSGSTVKIDKSDELKNLYELARRAKNDKQTENARRYYEKILERDPSSWEANFYASFFQACGCSVERIVPSANLVRNGQGTTLRLIQQHVSNPAEQISIVNQIAQQLVSLSHAMFESAQTHYSRMCRATTNTITLKQLRLTMANAWMASRDMLYQFGDKSIELFGNVVHASASLCWKEALLQHHYIMKIVGHISSNRKIMDQYILRIQQYEPTYKFKAPGCYVATCVYGSYDCPEVWTLRRYRDNTLSATWYGRAFIRTYYAVSPTLVKWFGQTRWFKKLWQSQLDHMVKRLNEQGVESTPYQDNPW